MSHRLALAALCILTSMAAGYLVLADQAPVVTLVPAQGPSGTHVQVGACGFTYIQHPPYPEFSVSVDGIVKAKPTGGRGCWSSVNIFGFGPPSPATYAPAQITIEGQPGKHIVRVEARTPNTAPQIAEATFTITAPVVTLSPAQGPPGTRVQVGACGFQYAGVPSRPDFSISVDGLVKAQTGASPHCTNPPSTGFGAPGTIVPAQTITIEGQPGAQRIVRVEVRPPNGQPEAGEAIFTITSGTPSPLGVAPVPNPGGLGLQRAVGTIAQLRVRPAAMPEGSGGPFPDAQAMLLLTGSATYYGLYVRDNAALAGGQVIETLRHAFLQNLVVEIWYQLVLNQPTGIIAEVVLRR